MSEKNKSASNAVKSGAPAHDPTEKPTMPEAGGDSDLELQELLRKYLPEFAEENQFSPDAPESDMLTDAFATATDAVHEEVPVSAEKERKSLFSRFRSSRKTEEDKVAPDSALFDQISAAAENPPEPEPDDDDMTIAPERPTASAGAAAEPEVPSSDESPETGDDLPPVDVSEWMIALGLEPEKEPATEPQPPKEDVPSAPENDPPEGETQEVDETVQNLLIGLGMDEQLDRRAGKGTADKTVARNDAEAREHEEQQRRALEYEYTERSQTPRIAEAYRYSLNSLKIRLAAAAVLTLALFFFENISLFGVQFAGALDPAVYPVVYIMVSLQLMLLVCAMAYEQIFAGIRNLVTGRPTPESVTAVLGCFGILYSAFAAASSVQGTEPVMYNFAVAVCALMSLIFAYLNTKREQFSFQIVSAKKPKYVFRRIPGVESTPESEAFGGGTDEDSPDVLQIEHARFVDGYFGRTTAVLHSTRIYVTAMLTVVTAAAVILGVFAAVGGASASTAVSVAYVSVLAALPMSMFFTYSYPFYKANRDAYEMESTIVGESSLEEYSRAAIISFDDKNVFPSYGVKVQNIKIEPNSRIDRVLYYASSAFAAAGGPLSDVFDVATMDMGHSDDVQILSAGVGYLEASVDGRRVFFGRSSVLTELGLDIPEDSVAEDSYIEGDLSIMYMMLDGQYVGKMFIKYIMDADFDFIVSQFANNGTCVCVKTLDPNIDDEMIFSKLKGRKYPLRVVKLHDGDAERERTDSGIVTSGTTKSLLQVVSLCDMVLSVKRTNTIISILSAVVTLIIMLIVALSGSLNQIGSWLLVLNQLFWMIPAVLTTKMFIK